MSDIEKQSDPVYFEIGRAIIELKLGNRVARSGWNGKGMWLVLVPGTPSIEVSPYTAYYSAGLREASLKAHIDMMCADGCMQPGWLASQEDLLASDWYVV